MTKIRVNGFSLYEELKSEEFSVSFSMWVAFRQKKNYEGNLSSIRLTEIYKEMAKIPLEDR